MTSHTLMSVESPHGRNNEPSSSSSSSPASNVPIVESSGGTRASPVSPASDAFDAVRFGRWMVGMCAVRFDLERGQVMEECFPAGFLSPEEESDVAFSAFPDSMATTHNRASIFDSVFFFRIRRRGHRLKSPPLPAASEKASDVCLPEPSPLQSTLLTDLTNAAAPPRMTRGNLPCCEDSHSSPVSSCGCSAPTHQLAPLLSTSNGACPGEQSPMCDNPGKTTSCELSCVRSSPRINVDKSEMSSEMAHPVLQQDNSAGSELPTNSSTASPPTSSSSHHHHDHDHHPSSVSPSMASGIDESCCGKDADPLLLESNICSSEVMVGYHPSRIHREGSAGSLSHGSADSCSDIFGAERTVEALFERSLSLDDSRRASSYVSSTSSFSFDGRFSQEEEQEEEEAELEHDQEEEEGVVLDEVEAVKETIELNNLAGRASVGGNTHRRSSGASVDSSSSSNGVYGSSPQWRGCPPGSGEPRYLYGYVFNRQRHDERLRRGGEQKSVVVLSERPYSSVFKALAQVAGPLYFDRGGTAFEHVAFHVSSWPPPQHGTCMELQVSGLTLKAHLPLAYTMPPGCGGLNDTFTSAMAPASIGKFMPQGVFFDADLFGMCKGLLLQLWVLWELLLVGEPLLVVAPTPSQCSEAVAALISIVAPLPCSIDFRPYFTIHDPDFPALNSMKEGGQMPPMLLGVTNLFFLKALRIMPHVVAVGSVPSAGVGLSGRSSLSSSSNTGGAKRSGWSVNGFGRSVGGGAGGKASSGFNGSGGGGGGLGGRGYTLSPLRRFSPSNLFREARGRKEGPLCLMSEHRQKLWTSYSPTMKPDTTVLNKLVEIELSSPRLDESMAMVNNEMLRRHFVELTTNFLAPFGPYLRATTPPVGVFPFDEPPPLNPFDAGTFLEGLKARGPGKFLSKRMRSNWLELYKRFLAGPNFMPWFQRRRAAAEREQHRNWRRARLKADVRALLFRMTEVEIVDAFAIVERQLVTELEAANRGAAGVVAGVKIRREGEREEEEEEEPAVCRKLRGDLTALFDGLPPDSQQMLLLFNPQRAALLHQGKREI